jgi:integrase
MMAQQMLTARTVETLKPGIERREIADRYLPGLYLIIQPSGAKSWAVRYRHQGRPRKHTIGGYPVFDLAKARAAAGAALRAVAEGRDPGREKASARTQRGADTIESIAAQFIERHYQRAGKHRAAAETRQRLELHVLPRWRGRLATDISRRDVLELLDAVVDSGRPIAANRVLASVRKMFGWCVARDILPASPCTGVGAPSAERPRDRVLTDPELRNVWLAADKMGGPFGALVKLLALTGQRRDEVARMQWSEINLQTCLWSLPADRTKNNRAHEIPLSAAAVSTIMALPRIGDKFALTNDGAAPASNYAANKRRLDALLPADMADWVLHDLRRSVASGMARLGINLPVIERVLNHSSGSFGGIVGVYQRHDFADEKRRALEAWESFVVDLVSDHPRQNVVRLESRQ